jgi:hypothetical protein
MSKTPRELILIIGDNVAYPQEINLSPGSMNYIKLKNGKPAKLKRIIKDKALIGFSLGKK